MSCEQSPACNREARFPLGQSVWDLRCTKANWDGFSPSPPVFHCQCNSIAAAYSFLYHLADGQ